MKIYLISRPDINFEEIQTFLKDEYVVWDWAEDVSHSENLVELAGRICYMSFGKRRNKKNYDFIRNLINKEHDSVLEHASWSFIITGVSRSFSHQLVRHRIGFSFSQLSQQYKSHRKAPFLLPPLLSKYPSAKKEWEKIIRQIGNAYNDILDILTSKNLENDLELERKEIDRALKSAARSILPNATETKIFVSANARALRHFLRIRGAIKGDYEMREFAVELLKILKKEAPSIFSDFIIKKLPDGSRIVIQNDG